MAWQFDLSTWFIAWQTEQINLSSQNLAAVSSQHSDSYLAKNSIANIVQEMNALACFQLGPYRRRSKIKKIANWLKDNKRLLNIKNVFVKVQKARVLASTWVYLPPFKNLSTARSVQQRLKQLGIHDNLIITKGKYKNTISLGVYRKPSNAKRRFNNLSAKGYQNVKTQKRYKTNYWLNIKISVDQEDLLKAFIQKIKQKIKIQLLKSMKCQKIDISQSQKRGHSK